MTDSSKAQNNQQGGGGRPFPRLMPRLSTTNTYRMQVIRFVLMCVLCLFITAQDSPPKLRFPSICSLHSRSHAYTSQANPTLAKKGNCRSQTNAHETKSDVDQVFSPAPSIFAGSILVAPEIYASVMTASFIFVPLFIPCHRDTSFGIPMNETPVERLTPTDKGRGKKDRITDEVKI